MLKIYKLTKEDLASGLLPPACLGTALQEGISKHSDFFLTERFFKDLGENYCQNQLKDTTLALNWLKLVNSGHNVQEKKHIKFFAFDFKSLYDNLKTDLVKEAIRHAMQTCRPGWSVNKKT